VLQIFSLVLSLVAVCLACWAVWTARSIPSPEPQVVDNPPPQPEPSAPPTSILIYGGHRLPLLTDVATNDYDVECFSVGETGRVTYEKDGTRAMVGIDVSAFQGEIDWRQVADSGIEFVMIRAGYRGYSKGIIVEDSFFRQNIAGALEAGLQVGVYIFSQAINVWEAEEEAAFLMEAVKDYNVTFPLVFDWEPIGAEARTDGLSAEALNRCAGAFCETVKEGGYTPVIYFNQNQGYLTYDLSKLQDYNFWLAEYRTVPSFYYHFDLWQYSAKGKVPGIQGDVDLDLCFVDFGALAAQGGTQT